MLEQKQMWTNPSVAKLAPGEDPIVVVSRQARSIVLGAVEDGLQGPPFDPLQFARYLKIPVVAREDVHEARTVLASGPRKLRIEFNPNRPQGRMRFSIAHELGHTLFPDCAEAVRHRSPHTIVEGDEWQVELLCNIAAAEFLMPIGTGINLAQELVTIENLLRLRNMYDVSVEALCRRVVKLTSEPCAFFAAARVEASDRGPVHRIDYTIPSRSWNLPTKSGTQIQASKILSECTAVGFTAKGKEKWGLRASDFQIEAVGIPPYPGHRYPRVVGVLFPTGGQVKRRTSQVAYLRGDATEPRGQDAQILAQIVNDKTPSWGGGFALVVRRKWPMVQESFRQWVAQDPKNLFLGKVHECHVSDTLRVFSMVAQHGYGPSTKPSIRYSSLRECLVQLGEMAASRGLSVAMPRIGTGQAGGNWAIVSELIDEVLCSRGVPVTVYLLPTDDFLLEQQGRLGIAFRANQFNETEARAAVEK
jgi:O-acetyl-ADP-ribose deacetylase (regulator of RNase III)